MNKGETKFYISTWNYRIEIEKNVYLLPLSIINCSILYFYLQSIV